MTRCLDCNGPLIAYYSWKLYRCADCKREYNINEIQIKHQR